MLTDVASIRMVSMLEVLLSAMKIKSGTVADAVGIHPVRFSEKLHGKKPFTKEELIRIAEYLKVDPGVLASNISVEDVLELALQKRNSDR